MNRASTLFGLSDRLRYLAVANRVRSERRMLKEALRERRLLLDDALEMAPPGFASARAVDVISWAPYFSVAKGERAMKRLGEPLHRRLGDMTRRRRRELIFVLAKSNAKAMWGAAHGDYIC